MGGLIVSVVLNYFVLLGLVFSGGGVGGAGWFGELARAIGMILSGAFLSSWGWLGALLGGYTAWRRVTARTPSSAAAEASGSDPERGGDAPMGMLRRGEAHLAIGMGLFGVAAWLAPQVMLGLLAFLLLPVVVVLLLGGVWRMRDRSQPGWRQAVGVVLILGALSGLFLSSVQAVDSSAREARLAQIREDRMRSVHAATLPGYPADSPGAELHAKVEAELAELAQHPAHRPPEPHWIGSATLWLAPILMGLGLFAWAGWSPGRCLCWAGIIWAFPYGMARLIQSLGPSMVLSA